MYIPKFGMKKDFDGSKKSGSYQKETATCGETIVSY
jgi:hypothetical protein